MQNSPTNIPETFAPVRWPEVEWVAIAELKANPKNARTHSHKQIKKIRRSLRTFGPLNPILVDENNVILAGHGRAEAARQEGLSHLPVLRYRHLTDAQKRAYLIADNKIAQEAGWDRELLALELGELVEFLPTYGLDVALTGFESAEIDLLIADFGDAPQASDVLPPVPKHPTTRPGDLWQLGKHRLLCGDARHLSNFERLLAGETAAAVFCDPPYNLAVKTIGGRGRIHHAEFAFASGEMSYVDFRQFLRQTLGNGVQVSASGAVHYTCMHWQSIADLITVGRELYGSMLNVVVWNKTNAGQGSFYRSQHELIGVFAVAGGTHRNNIELGRFGRNRSNVWTYPGINSFGQGRMEALHSHPTVKPTTLVADALLDCTVRGDAVLDQFAGSGTIFLAAEKVGRKAYGIEFEPRYVDVAVLRWQDATKRDAVLVDDGRTFAEIFALRSEESHPAPHAEDDHA